MGCLSLRLVSKRAMEIFAIGKLHDGDWVAIALM
jgi:hypothetical protein